MDNQLSSEFCINLESAKKCIQAQQWADLPIDQIEYVCQGWDNVAFLVNKQWIFRFPKREESEQFLLDENIILPALQGRTNLQIPNPVFLGKPTAEYPFHFHGYQMVAGTPFYKVDLSPADLLDSVIQLAQFLKSLHSISADQAEKMGIRFQAYDKTKVLVVIEVLRERLDALAKQNAVALDMVFIEEMIEQARAIHLDHEQDCLVHGDIDVRHLLVLDQKLSGIIDWGEVGINHPVIDLAAVTNIFPVSVHELFFKEYGAVSADVYNYARFLTLYRAATLMMSAHETGDTQMFAVAHRSYQRLKIKS